jgi:hypothetical protein
MVSKLTEQDKRDLLETYPHINRELLGMAPSGTGAESTGILHINSKKEGDMRINQGGRFSHEVRDALNNQPKQNKMHVASKELRTYRGITFKSKKEASKCAELDLCKLAGEIKGYLMQVAFTLPGKTKSGRPIRHYVDFAVIELDDRVSWIEMKGRDLELGRLKRVQVEELYGIKIRVE